MNTINLLDKLREKPVFRIEDVRKITGRDRKYSTIIIHRLKARNLIKRVTKNRYTTKDNIYLIASNLIYPSYISFWSASAFLGYTEQIPATIQVAVTRKAKSINFEGYKIKFIKFSGKEFFGYRKIQSDYGSIFIAEDEKLIIDAVNKQKECGNLAEIENIVKNAEVDADKIIAHLKLINKPALTKRVGYLLEKIKGIDISDKFQLNTNYIILDQFSKKQSKINSKWMIKI